MNGTSSNYCVRLCGLLFLLVAGCRLGTEAPQCDTGASDPAPRLADSKPYPNADWCRACVMSPQGFASCQRVYAQSTDESRDSVRQRSLDKSCADAGFEKDACPRQAVIGVGCKDDPPQPGGKDPGQALQDLFMSAQGKAPQAGSQAPSVQDESEKRPLTTDPPVL